MGKLRQLTKAKLLVTFTNLSASIGIICAHLFRLKMLVYCYEPHSDFLVELGIWRKGSIKHRISRWIELYAGKRADFVMASTKYVADLLTDFKVKGRVVRAPVSVDENKFLFKSKGREKIRQIYDLKNRNVFLYLGKFGYLYYNEEIAKLCKTLFDNIDNSFFLIVTSNDQETIRRMFQRNGLPEGSFFVTGNLSYEEVKDYISAADIGLSAVSPTPSQKFRSPTKVAEYLLCGLPYITCEGVSEDDIYAIKHNVGAVVKSFDENHIIESIFQIQNLLNEEKVSIRERCRNVGISYRGKSNIDQLFQQFFREIYVH
jgi:desulfoferrodoxin (superoxide reductase-like protein)